ncbi:Hypothetical protein CINCED_3A008030 [Cinara cedri]|uniref:HIT domain-containing protein n=1 Tax=Cinara cedri TaxID=506608 RepID=A0A5E4NMQ5_9HEMI|nr:Hypothetical protein CINCED_3A008030 [Cinara cedri]
MALKNDLIVAMDNKSVRLYEDEFMVIIADVFPKSKHHYLVLPKEHIQEVNSLKTHHIPKLIYMELKGLEFVVYRTMLPARCFQVGYHAYPSMNRLHLHILSKDFNSVHLRHPFQWNSFHTEFFVPTYSNYRTIIRKTAFKLILK